MYGTFWRQLKAAIPATALIVATVAVVLAGTTADASANPTVTVPIPAGRPGTGSVPVLLTGDSTALTLGLALSYAADQSKDGIDVIDKAIDGCGVAEGRTVMSDGVVNRCLRALQSECARRPAVAGPARAAAVPVPAAGGDPAGRPVGGLRPVRPGRPDHQHHRSELRPLRPERSSNGSWTSPPRKGPGGVDDRAVLRRRREQRERPTPARGPARSGSWTTTGLVRAVVRANPNTTTLSPLNAIVCPDGHFTLTIGTVVVRAPDGVHFPFFTIFSNDTARAGHRRPGERVRRVDRPQDPPAHRQTGRGLADGRPATTPGCWRRTSGTGAR